MGNWFTDTLDAIGEGAKDTGGWLANTPIGESVESGARWAAGTAVGEIAIRSTERFFQGYEWVYDNAISQPMSTGILMAQRPGELLSPSEWARTWRAAEYISPGQAAQLPFAEGGALSQLSQINPLVRAGASFGLFGDSGNAQQAVNSPLVRYAPPGIERQVPGWDQMGFEEQQSILEEMGMPVDPMGGNAFIAELRESSLGYRHFSGVNDFAARWYADPLVIAGKAGKAALTARSTYLRPRQGWNPGRIEDLVNNSRTAQLVRFLDENRANPALVNNTDMAMRSAMGPRLGAVNSVLRDAEDVRDFIRVGMGDIQAQARLTQRNALAEQRLNGYRSRLSITEDFLSSNYRGPRAEQMRSMAMREVERLNRAINADEAMVTSYSRILEHADEIDQLHLSRWQFGRAERRTRAQRDYRAAPARGKRARGMTGPPEGSGIITQRLWGIGDAFTMPLTMVRMAKNVKPNGYLEMDNGAFASAENIAELRGQIARIPGLTPETRETMVNRWLRTSTEGERLELVEQLSETALSRLAAKHGLSEADGRALYQEIKVRREGARAELKNQFSAAQLPGAGPGGQPLRVDVFENGSGVLLDPRPHTVSRLMNNHILDDLDQLDRIFRRHGSALRSIRQSAGNARDWITQSGEILNQYWKFATLFRLGYIPRAIGDEIAGQVAALGAATIAARAGYGVRNLVTNAIHRDRRALDEVTARVQQETITWADEELALLRPELRRLTGAAAASNAAAGRGVERARRLADAAQARLTALPETATPARRRAHEEFLRRRQQQLQAAEARAARTPVAPRRTARLEELRQQVAQLEYDRGAAMRRRDELSTRNEIVRQGTQPVRIGGTTYPAAFGGQRGEYWMKKISPDEAYDQLLKTSRQMIHMNLLRSFDNGARPVSAVDGEAVHAQAWAHAVNAQIAQDGLQRLLLQGASDADAVRWLRNTNVGRAYWTRLGLQDTATYDRVVAGARQEIDEYLPLPEIRMQALTPEGVTPDFLQRAVTNPLARPTVHMGTLGTTSQALQGMNRVMKAWYNFAVALPSKHWSRHPLFNQMYDGHLRAIVAQRAQQGARPRTVEEVEAVAETARRLAGRDTKRLVFDIAHQSDASAALRFISPFFSATAESFQRWGRIIGDKPEVVGYAAKFYNAPAYMGHMQTIDGNEIFPDGTYLDPVTGERKLAPKNDRWIVGRMPEWLIDTPLGVAMGVERSSGNFMLSQNSVNVVTQGDPWYNPGVGPIVQIPVNEFVKDKPTQAELARHLGILPFGPNTAQNPVERFVQGAAPATIRNFLTAYDTSDYRYQQVKMQITQRAIFEHETTGKPMPSAEEIADMTREYWMFSAASSFIQPASTQRRDGYEFYRQQYRNLQRANPETADIEFLGRFGEEYFIFAQSMSKNVAGIQATNRAVELSQQYSDVLAENPELGSLIIGPEGNGPFSPEAYAYQLNTPIEPGDAEAQRRRLSASEMLAENQRRKGWAQYTAFMNGLNSELFNRGMTSLEDEGASDLHSQRKAYVAMLTEPMLPDGSANPFHNEEFSKDWFSFDSRKYERLIPALERVSTEILERDPDRTDLQVLQTYLAGRQALSQILAGREYTTLGARANAGLRRAWSAWVASLVESDTGFGDLHSRYLSRDLGIDFEEEAMTLEQEEVTAGGIAG